MRAHPVMNERRLGRSPACDQPWRSPQGVSSNRASAGWVGGVGFGGTHTGQAGHGAATGQLMGGVASTGWGAGFSGWVVTGAQAAKAPASRIAADNFTADRTMWVIFLEMGVALSLLLLIVWWTWPKKRPEDEDKR